MLLKFQLQKILQELIINQTSTKIQGSRLLRAKYNFISK